MKQVIRIAFAAAVLAATALGQSVTSSFTARAHIPFDFVVQNETLPAGDYLIQLPSASPTALMIRQAKGNKKLFIQQVPMQEKWNYAAQLTFNKIGRDYYLFEVADPRVGVQRLQQGNTYKRAQKLASAQTVTVATN